MIIIKISLNKFKLNNFLRIIKKKKVQIFRFAYNFKNKLNLNKKRRKNN